MAGGALLLPGLLPEAVVTAETRLVRYADPRFPAYPEEDAAVAGAVQSRREEFAAVRTLARRATAELGVAPAPLLPGRTGAPQWPEGVVGSLTHCAGFRGAAVARGEEVGGLGIDAEPDEALPDGVAEVVLSASEAAAVRMLPRGVAWDRLVFCAKEAVYKVWSPLTGRRLEHAEARVALDPGGTFTAELLVDAPARLAGGLTGRWRAADGLLVAATWISP